MITVHVSPSTKRVVIEHLSTGSLDLSPEDAYSLLQRLKERQQDIYNILEREKRSKGEYIDERSSPTI